MYPQGSFTLPIQVTVSGVGTGAVDSFNTRTGDVVLSSADVSTALGYSPFNKVGDSITVADGGNIAGITLTQNDVTNNPKAISVTNAGTGNSLYIDANGAVGTGTSTSGAILLDNTGNSGYGLNIYSNRGAGSSGLASLLKIHSANAAFDDPLVYIVDVSTNGAAANIRMDSPNPDIELIRTDLDNTTGKGKFEFDVGPGNEARINSRNAANTSFETIVGFGQLQEGGVATWMSPNATALATITDSAAIRFRSSYWNGSSSIDRYVKFLNIMSATTPTYRLSIQAGSNGAEAEVANFSQLGALTINDQTAPATPTTATTLYSDTSHRLAWKSTNGFVTTLDSSANTASRVYTLPNFASGTLVLDDAAQVLTNKTLTSPKIGTAILDTNGNNLFALTATTTAVNYLTYANSATLGALSLTATGSDTNIGIGYATKGTGAHTFTGNGGVVAKVDSLSGIATALAIVSNSNAANDRGSKIDFFVPNATASNRRGGAIGFAQESATNSYCVFQTESAGSIAERWRITAAGSLQATEGVNMIFGTTTGTKIGTATTQKIGVYNATPVVQPASANQASVVTTAATNVTPYGFATQAQADALVTLVNQLRADLVTLGWIKGSA